MNDKTAEPRGHDANANAPVEDAMGELAATGIAGLDDILYGGFVRNRLYLIEGFPGSGKTTLALQFLLDGLAHGERVLYVTLSESVDELVGVIHAHGWSTDGIAMRELAPATDSLNPEDRYTMFHPSEVELSEATKTILGDVERLRPHRIVFDSLSEMRLLAGNALRYRRQILALKHYFTGKCCTVLMLDDRTSTENDMQVHSLAHGVVNLEQIFPEYGVERRRLRVVKYRGKTFRGGNHDYVIRHGGLQVFPRLVASEHRGHPDRTRMPTGVAALDSLMGGGIERSTSTLIVGAPGTGKSSLAAQFAACTAHRGEGAAMFIFDESVETLLSRSDNLGISLRQPYERGIVSIQPVDPAELAPGQLVALIRTAVEERGVRTVVIDSLNGYLNAMPEERFLAVQLHELLAYLGQRGVATLLVSAHAGLVGGAMQSPIEASYLVDAVILLRYFEARGEIRQAISVVKKRGGAHERTIREFRLDNGIHIGEPLRDFRGVLTGVPTYEGKAETLMPKSSRVSDARNERHQTRVLVLAPGGKDATLARTVLANANIECEVVADIVTLVRGIAEGVGAVLVTEEAIAEGSGNLLALEIVRQPPWSDLPILVMTHQGADSPVAVQALQSLGNVTLLERPIRVSALVSAVRSALRARHRQHQTRQYLHERERTAAQLREADRRKDEFLATLAHELRNPLSPISNALEILRLSGNADPGAQPVLEMMERQVNHLVRLVDDLLDVSRVTLGKMVLRRAPIAIGDVLESAIESSRPLIASRRHRLSTTIPEEPLIVDGDAVRLAQVFANLLNNAAKYTNEQGKIAVTARREGKDVVVAVRDNGLGIPEEMLGRVFEIFAQVDGLQGRAGGGLGIGLTLVRSLVAMHGGSVAVVSEGRGKGSEFVVRLPLSVATEPRIAAPRHAPAGGAATHRVLVVDDNVDAAESLGMVLDLLGAEVRVVNSGPDALAMMASYAPTAVVLDIGMPGMDGYEVARRIRSERRHDAVTLIAMTGWGQDEDRRRTRAEGFDHHLIKPPDIVALQTVLASIGDGTHRSRALHA